MKMKSVIEHLKLCQKDVEPCLFESILKKKKKRKKKKHLLLLQIIGHICKEVNNMFSHTPRF